MQWYSLNKLTSRYIFIKWENRHYIKKWKIEWKNVYIFELRKKTIKGIWVRTLEEYTAENFPEMAFFFYKNQESESLVSIINSKLIHLKKSHLGISSCCSIIKLYLTLWDLMDYSTTGFPFLYLQEFAQTHVHWVTDSIQPSHPLSHPSCPALDLFQHQGLFQWVSSLYHAAKVLEVQLQHQSFQWIFRVDFL